MRDPARIHLVLTALRHYWNRNPDLRLGQIVGNMAAGIDTRRSAADRLTAGLDPYYIEDDELAERLLNAIRESPSDPA